MEKSSQLAPICAYKKQVYQACINPTCIQICFICENNNCQCKVLHQQCDKIDWIYITKKLNRKTLKSNPEFKSFSDTLDYLYQTIIKNIDKAYDNFKAWRDDFGLTEYQLSFMHLIEEGRFTELTSAKMYEIRKEIKIPSKMIIKSENQLKQEIDLINNYKEKLIELLKGLYTQNKVIKEQIMEQKQINNNDSKIKVVQHIQPKVNLAHKLLGLNENGSKFFTMINQGVIEKQLDKIIEKINQKEESITDNKKGINETINNIKQKIEKLTETVNQVKIETKLNIIKHKLIISVNVLFDFLKTSPSYILFQNQIIMLSQTLRKECLNKYSKIEEKLKFMMQDYNANKISFQKWNQQFSKLEEEAEHNRKEIDLKINMEIGNIKINTISMFFANKKIKTLNLLYKASENNFQVSKFWDKCHGKTNTLTILKTQFNKIIGGYTPLAWNKSLGNYQQDISKQTFLFSLTQKYKIPISRNQIYATYHYANYGPTFGGGFDLYICDKANLNENSNGNIGYVYNNGEYTYGTQQAYKKWSGQISGNRFLIQEWQVYEIKFE